MLLRIIRIGFVIVLAGSILTVASPAQAASCADLGILRWGGPTGKYGVKGLVPIIEPTNLPCNGGQFDDRRIGVQLFKDFNHFVFWGWTHLDGCFLHDQTCFKWIVAWQDGSGTDETVKYGDFNLTCWRYGGSAYFSIRQDTPGDFITSIRCPGDAAHTPIYSIPHLSFSTGRATVEVFARGATAANGAINELVKEENLGDNMSKWPSAPVCMTDTVPGWDGIGQLRSDGGSFSTYQATHGC
jgi:hypothetical protein